MLIQRQAPAVFLLAVAVGIFLSPVFDHSSFLILVSEQIYGLIGVEPDNILGDPDEEVDKDYALFSLVVNGSEKHLGEERHQQSPDAYLGNRTGNVVHVRSENATWRGFLDSINITVDDQICLEGSDCREGTVVLNDKTDPDLSAEISQADNMLIVIDTEDEEEIIDSIMGRELPEIYREEEIGVYV